MPLHAELFPVIEPFHFFARSDEKLHFHLLEFAHAEDKLAGNNFVAKCFPDLCNSGKEFSCGRFSVHSGNLRKFPEPFPDEDILSSCLSKWSHFREKHQIELTNFGPVAFTTDWTNNFGIDDDLSKPSRLVSLRAFVKRAWISSRLRVISSMRGFVSRNIFSSNELPKRFKSFFHFFLDFFVEFG